MRVESLCFPVSAQNHMLLFDSGSITKCSARKTCIFQKWIFSVLKLAFKVCKNSVASPLSCGNEIYAD